MDKQPTIWWKVFYRDGSSIELDGNNIPQLCIRHPDAFINKAVINVVFYRIEFAEA